MVFAAASPPKSYPFYNLTKGHKHIRPNVNSYWRHLTLSSYEVYEAIYNSCKDHRGRVNCKSPRSIHHHHIRQSTSLTSALVPDFSAQFLTAKTPLNTIEKTWTRLLSDQRNISNSVHPKGLAMATMYMLHIERYLPNEKPLDNNKTIGVSTERRELLKAFGNWVPCQCKQACGVEWNFADDIGLHRGGNAKDCRLVEVVDKQILKNLSIEKDVEVLKLTKKKWRDSRAPH
jgi:calcium-independent phospholipase A2-gamma